MSREDIEAAFPDWTVIGEEAADVTSAPRPVKKADPRFYRLWKHVGSPGDWCARTPI
jgi:hypothetical protein